MVVPLSPGELQQKVGGRAHVCCMAHTLHLHLPGPCSALFTPWLLSFPPAMLQVDAIFKHQSQVRGSGKQDCKHAVPCRAVPCQAGPGCAVLPRALPRLLPCSLLPQSVRRKTVRCFLGQTLVSSGSAGKLRRGSLP